MKRVPDIWHSWSVFWNFKMTKEKFQNLALQLRYLTFVLFNLTFDYKVNYTRVLFKPSFDLILFLISISILMYCFLEKQEWHTWILVLYCVSAAESEVSAVTFTYNSKRFYWHMAKSMCEYLGQRLAVLDTEEKLDALKEQVWVTISGNILWKIFIKSVAMILFSVFESVLVMW